MSRFKVTEFDLVIKVQIATYYPLVLKDDKSKLLMMVTKAVHEASRSLDFVSGVTTITLKEKENETTNPT